MFYDNTGLWFGKNCTFARKNEFIMSTSDIVILVAVILVYFGWALFNGFLAKLRNHSFSVWFGISICIIPPFAMIAMLVLCKPDNNHLIP